MPEERLSQSLQESIVLAVTLIDDDNSAVISNLIDPSLIDEPLSDIVSTSIEYRKQYKKPPGRGHVDDIFAYVLENKEHKHHKTYHHFLKSIVSLEDKTNTQLILDKLQEFMWIRQNRTIIGLLADAYQKGGNDVLDNFETLYRQGLKIRSSETDYGFSLADSRALSFLNRDAVDYCLINIPELDKHGCHPAKKELLNFMAARNRGKSQFLHHCGKYALLKGWCIVHYTLENSEEMTSMRYFQTLFNGVRREGDYHYMSFYTDDYNQTKLKPINLKPDFIIEHKESTLKFLNNQINKWHYRLENLIIKAVPTGRLTVDQIERDLDNLALLYKFYPSILLIDSPQLMKMNRQRESFTALDDVYIDLRGLAVDRNLAIVTTQQGNRSADQAKLVQSYHAAGSIGSMNIADNAITYSQTEAEEKLGMARLYAQKIRNDTARFTLLISQHYPTGQFCMDSQLMNDALRDVVKSYVDYKPGEQESGEEDFSELKKRVKQ